MRCVFFDFIFPPLAQLELKLFPNTLFFGGRGLQ
jgi:hypothetical protein